MERRMMLAMMLSPGDVAQGVHVLRLWADLESCFNPRITVAICTRFDLEPSHAVNQELLGYVSNKFKVFTHRVTRKGTGWPAGCNALEIGAYEWFVESNRNRLFDIEYFMIAESDTVPLRRGWADEIMNEAYDTKTLMLGAFFTAQEGCHHINGNCVLHRNTWKKMPEIWQVPSRAGWDAYIGKKSTAIGTPSRLIWQDYRLGAPDNPWKGDDYLFAKKSYQFHSNPLYNQELTPAMIHGVKTLQGIRAVRERVLGEKIPWHY